MARSLNRVQLIGNLTRDPELRYTPNGNAVCSFGIATNRNWTTDSGEKREEVDFHRIIAWNKLAELCSQFLVKGRKVYVEGRLSTRNWTGQDGQQKTTTEVVIDDMILLDSKGATGSTSHIQRDHDVTDSEGSSQAQTRRASEDREEPEGKNVARVAKKKVEAAPVADEEEVMPDDIPF